MRRKRKRKKRRRREETPVKRRNSMSITSMGLKIQTTQEAVNTE